MLVSIVLLVFWDHHWCPDFRSFLRLEQLDGRDRHGPRLSWFLISLLHLLYRKSCNRKSASNWRRIFDFSHIFSKISLLQKLVKAVLAHLSLRFFDFVVKAVWARTKSSAWSLAAWLWWLPTPAEPGPAKRLALASFWRKYQHIGSRTPIGDITTTMLYIGGQAIWVKPFFFWCHRRWLEYVIQYVGVMSQKRNRWPQFLWLATCWSPACCAWLAPWASSSKPLVTKLMALVSTVDEDMNISRWKTSLLSATLLLRRRKALQSSFLHVAWRVPFERCAGWWDPERTGEALSKNFPVAVHCYCTQAVVFWGGLFGMITVPVFTAVTQCPAWSGSLPQGA